MKKILSIFVLCTTILGAISGAILQSSAIALVAGVVSNFDPTVTIGAFSLSMLYAVFAPEAPKGYAFLVFTKGICPAVQKALNDYVITNGTNLKRTQVGYLQAITSPTNTAGTSQIPIDLGDGKIHSVRLKYSQRGTSADLTTTRITDCSTSLEKQPFTMDVDVDQFIGTKGIKFREDEMRKLCEPDSTWMAEVINNEIDPLVVELNKKLITLQSINFGQFNPAAAGYKSVQLLDASNKNAPVYYGESQIVEDFAYLDTNAKPLVIGAGKLSHYVRQVGIGCCNSLGQNIAQAGNMDFYHDRFVGGILGNADRFIALVPGYVQLLTYNRYVGTYAKENGVFSHGTIKDPFTGLTFDMKWHYNDCDDTYSLQIELNYDLFFLPSDAFAYGDELNNVNFTLPYLATAA